MRKIIKLLIIGLLLYSCNSTEREYYSDGNIKAEYNVKDDLLDGQYIEYYRNGKIKQVHSYRLNKKVDTSIFYNENGLKNHMVYWSDNEKNKILYFNKNEEIVIKGMIFGDDESFRIDNWTFKNKDVGVDSIVEYVNYKNRPYANQIWLKNINGDTIPMKGNFYKFLTAKDTISVNEAVKLQFFLYEPYLDYFKSEVSIILPENEDELAEDFSNLFDIETSTFQNLRNDGIPHPEIDDEILKNRIVAFGLVFEKVGKKKIRGALIEKVKQSTDSTIFNQRILFFNKEIFVVKDSLPN